MCPVAIGFLRGLEVVEDAEGIVVRAGSEQSTGVFDQIARPDEMVAAEIFIAFVESPGHGEAGDDAAEKILGFMRAQDGGAGTI